MTPATVPATVVVPTIGRPEHLRKCLDALSRCKPRAAEILVVDQSGDEDVAAAVEAFAQLGACLVHCQGTGRGKGVNVGLLHASNEVVLVTDDDCVVSPSWVKAGLTHVRTPGRPRLVTGQVLPDGDAQAVPSTIDDALPKTYTNPSDCGRLYAGNMACIRESVVALGGFDELIRPAAEDVEFCYRWLRSGHVLRYEPDLVVWHSDWRTKEQLEELYVGYARGVGAFYAKHLRRRDLRIVLLLVRDLVGGLRGMASRLLRGRPRWSDSRQGLLRGLPAGLRDGWRTFDARA